MNIKNQIEDSLSSIVESLHTHYLLNDEENQNIGIANGISGAILFYAYLARLRNLSKYEEYFFHAVGKALEILSKGSIPLNLSNGVVGFSWVMEHLIQQQFIDSEGVDDILEEIDTVIEKEIMKLINEKNFDFLNGSLGLGLYLIERYNRTKKNIELIEVLTNSLINDSIQDDVGCKWMTIDFLNEESFNYGLAHGIPSNISMLVKLLDASKSNSDGELCLQNAVKHILSKENSKEGKVISLFPTYIKPLKSELYSRLAWCHGDLGVGISLYNSSKYMKDETLESKALEILQKSSARRSLKENKIFDASLCHGSSGVSHIFKRMYVNTGNKEFNETADYWIRKTIEFSKYNKGIIEFSAINDNDKRSNNDFGFLEGMAGIGLALVSYISTEEPAWDRVLLLS